VSLTDYTDADLEAMDDDKLLRKANQSWEMAGLARQDRDTADEKRHTDFARRCDAELARRRGQ